MAVCSMNVRKLSEALGARVLVSFPASGGTAALCFFCIVEDVRRAFDRVDLLVSPENGFGQAWVSLSRVERTPSGVCHFPAPAIA